MPSPPHMPASKPSGSSSASTIASAQSARWRTLPSQFAAPYPQREAALEGFRQRNAFLDAIFYDVGVLSDDEAERLAPRYAAEGAILAVGSSRERSLHHWPDIDAFAADAYRFGASEVTTLAVAGVGSSALGAAAFARNVADAIDAPVLAVVSGYGLSDLLTEAIGGFFLFGYVNSLRRFFEPLDTLTRPRSVPELVKAAEPSARRLSPAASSPDAGAWRLPDLVDMVRQSLDVQTLLALLRGPWNFDLLVGHSKGNLVVSEALFALGDQDRARLDERAAEMHVVTISARIAMPRACRKVTDVMGSLDWFGALNSRVSIPTDIAVEGAWHHTNTEVPFHLPVTQELKKVLGARD